LIAVRSLSRIVLICGDAARLAAFYQRAFGFADLSETPMADPAFAELIGRADGRVLLKLLSLGDQHIALAQPEPLGASYPDRIPGWDPRFQHFAIVVADMKAALATLEGLSGWQAISVGGPQTLPPTSGAVTAFKFRDPEGHPLELLAYSPTATPVHWARRSAKTCLGIDHSAISVANTRRSAVFYHRLGLTRIAASLNTGPEQQSLDDVADALVEVTALAPMCSVPHVELLCYRGNFDRSRTPSEAADAAATQLVFDVPRDAFAPLIERMREAVVRGPIASATGLLRALLCDPDGHWLCLESVSKDQAND
jgi:catechol 2,3-dioxygenase-like lactoylglutathione lyase family enzyme